MFEYVNITGNTVVSVILDQLLASIYYMMYFIMCMVVARLTSYVEQFISALCLQADVDVGSSIHAECDRLLIWSPHRPLLQH